MDSNRLNWLRANRSFVASDFDMVFSAAFSDSSDWASPPRNGRGAARVSLRDALLCQSGFRRLNRIHELSSMQGVSNMTPTPRTLKYAETLQAVEQRVIDALPETIDNTVGE